MSDWEDDEDEHSDHFMSGLPQFTGKSKEEAVMFLLELRAYATGRGFGMTFEPNFEGTLPAKESDVLDPTKPDHVLMEKAKMANEKMMAALILACEGFQLTCKIWLELERDPEYPSGRFPSALEAVIEDFNYDDDMMAQVYMQGDLHTEPSTVVGLNHEEAVVFESKEVSANLLVEDPRRTFGEGAGTVLGSKQEGAGTVVGSIQDTSPNGKSLRSFETVASRLCFDDDILGLPESEVIRNSSKRLCFDENTLELVGSEEITMSDFGFCMECKEPAITTMIARSSEEAEARAVEQSETQVQALREFELRRRHEESTINVFRELMTRYHGKVVARAMTRYYGKVVARAMTGISNAPLNTALVVVERHKECDVADSHLLEPAVNEEEGTTKTSFPQAKATGTIESKMNTSSGVTLAAENSERQLVVFKEERCVSDQLEVRREYSLASGMQFNAPLELKSSAPWKATMEAELCSLTSMGVLASGWEMSGNGKSIATEKGKMTVAFDIIIPMKIGAMKCGALKPIKHFGNGLPESTKYLGTWGEIGTVTTGKDGLGDCGVTMITGYANESKIKIASEYADESTDKTSERKMVSVQRVNESSDDVSSVRTKKRRGKKFKFKYYSNANCRDKKASVSTKGSSDYDLWFTKLKGPLYEGFVWSILASSCVGVRRVLQRGVYILRYAEFKYPNRVVLVGVDRFASATLARPN